MDGGPTKVASPKAQYATPAPLFAQQRLPLPRPDSDDGRAWAFEGAGTQYATHGIHTYLAAMIPQLARRLVETYVAPKGAVLDPFCGGGAVLVETTLTGREAAGRDINDLAVLITKAKTTHIPKDEVAEATSAIVERARLYRGQPLSFERADYVHYWFKPYMLGPLTALRLALDDLQEGPMKTLQRVIFSATVRDVSLTYRNEIRLRRMSPKEQEKFNPDVFGKFLENAKQAADRVSELPAGARSDVDRGDARRLPFRNKEFAAVVCSPPYGDERNGVPYAQFAKNMLLWLGYRREDLMGAKKASLGWHKGDKVAPPSTTLYRTLERITDNPVACREAIAFYHDYFLALGEMTRVAKDAVIIVIGQRVLHKTVFDNAAITCELMQDLGIGLEALHIRRLPSKRLPKMREFGAAIDRETILVFRK